MISTLGCVWGCAACVCVSDIEMIKASHMGNSLSRMRGLWLTSVSLCACATVPVREAPEAASAESEWLSPPPMVKAPVSLADRIAHHADSLVGMTSLKPVTTSVPDDCTGLVRYAYSREGIELMPDVAPRGSN